MAGNCYNRDGNCEPDERCRCNDEKPESRILGYEILFSSGMSDEEIEGAIDELLRTVHDKKIIAFVSALDHKQRLELIKRATV